MEAIFGNGHPVEIEIGCGKGKFLIARAAGDPEINFLGLDRVSKWMSIGQKRGEKRQLENLRFLRAEAREWIAGLCDGSVGAFHIYFPDPWPKRRHRRRRLITENFLKQIERVLAHRGKIYIATDDADYYRQIRSAAESTRDLWGPPQESINHRMAFETLKTHYEIKYEHEHRTLYYLILEKRNRPVPRP